MTRTTRPRHFLSPSRLSPAAAAAAAAAALSALWLAAAVVVPLARGAATFEAKDRQPTPEELTKLPGVVAAKVAGLMKDLKVPAGFKATLFATPPAVNYPVFLSAAPDGTLFVCSDGNGSLDRKAHMGRVLRVRDTDGDGQGDEVKAFVPDVDSPRGLVWDHDRLYLLHPPDISVFIDHDQDGVADEKRTLIHGIGWTFKDRPADHASNGLELGMDGWLYAAIGDFGFMEALGTDGRKLQLRGGGVVRLRPDGSRMELWANGTRNIFEVAVSPLLDSFARDNTNDGGGWDVRFHHFSGFTQHGYPRLFKNFADEIVTPLADYGGGSGCGAAWIDEPGIPAKWNNAPFTADWGREWIYHHGLTQTGATYAATQEEFLRLPRVTDLDVDGRSAIYAASWKGASFTWVGPDVGFIVRVTPEGYQPEPLPDFEKATDPALVKLLESTSHRRRLEAQRTLVRRLESRPDKKTSQLLARLASDSSKAPATRVAALFALSLGTGSAADSVLAKLSTDPAVGGLAMRALSERPGEASGIPVAPFLAGLKQPDPRLKREAIVGLTRLGSTASAPRIIPLLADADPIVAHTAVQGLMRLNATKDCLAVVEDPSAGSDRLRPGALRVLQSLHESPVVDHLIDALRKEKEASRRAGIITALCRLHSEEGPWQGDSWGTRPDTRGPYYQPKSWSETERIAATLKSTLERADATEAAWIAREMGRHRIQSRDAVDQLVLRARTDATLLPALASQLADAEETPASAIPLLAQLATAEPAPDAARAQAVIALARTSNEEGWRAVLAGLPRVEKTSSENNLAERARRAVLTSRQLPQLARVLASVAASVNGPSSLLAEQLLLKVASGRLTPVEDRTVASQSLDAGWAEPRRRLQILRAAAEVGDASRAAQFVAALNDGDAEVARQARETVRRLKINPEKFQAEAAAPRLGTMNLEDTLAQVTGMKGEASRGEQLFGQIGCNACHTVKTDEPLKGPFLGTVANIYRRRELAEAILLPNKTIAQGFVANHFELKDGTEVDGFVVREAADAVTIRTIAAVEQSIAVNQITKREKQERSLMPEGLVTNLTMKEFSSLIDYLESLPQKK